MRAHGLPTLRIDGSRDVEATVAAVEQRFRSVLREGPRAETADERRALLREANEALASQVRGYYARPWASGDPDEVVRDFLCECGDRVCVESVYAAVRTAREPLLAGGHG